MRQPPPSFQSHSDRGTDGIQVEMYPTIHAQDAAHTIASFYLSTWDDPVPIGEWDESDAMRDLAWMHAQNAMAGKVLPNTLESISITFAITGISRATTHQLVRSRVGAVFGQQGGRDNNWTNYNMRIPETLMRATELGEDLIKLQRDANSLYHRAIMAGVPYQDARYVLPMGLETALVASYNLLSFKSLAARRLCNRMMWETNYVVRLMTDRVVERFPFVGRSLRSSCEQRGVCGSVSPMFPPACLFNNQGVPDLAKDNPTLKHTMVGRDYDWPESANGSWRHFGESDAQRLRGEISHRNHARSLIHPELTLAIEDEHGLWRKNHV